MFIDEMFVLHLLAWTSPLTYSKICVPNAPLTFIIIGTSLLFIYVVN